MNDSNTQNDVRAILAEQKAAETIKRLSESNAPLFQRITATAENVSTITRDTLDNSNEVTIARKCAQSIKSAFETYAAKTQEIRADTRGYGERWREDEIAKAAEERDQEIQRARGLAESHLDALDKRYAGWTDEPISSDLAAESQLIIARFGAMSGAGFLKEVSEKLHRAADPTTPEATRKRLNLLLEKAYAPLVERRATAPESHSRFLSPAASELHAAIETHLGTVTGRSASNSAREITTSLRQSFNRVHNTISSGLTAQDWDLLEMSNPELFPAEASQWWSTRGNAA